MLNEFSVPWPKLRVASRSLRGSQDVGIIIELALSPGLLSNVQIYLSLGVISSLIKISVPLWMRCKKLLVARYI